MKVLVVGSGGREHALAWKLAQASRVSKVYVAPGNGGTAREEMLENVAISDINQLADFCQANEVTLTVVGPDAALADGIVDAFKQRGLNIFGPTKAAAKLEWSKDFAKQFMLKYNIPTAKYATFTQAKLAHEYIDQQGVPIVIKADGLAAGKGVVVAETLEQAHQGIKDILEDKKFSSAGAKVVIEEFMPGEEASFFVLADGENFVVMPAAQDHKRLLDKDQGPNTGGMGSYTPAPIITPEIRAKVVSRIVKPTISGMQEEGTPFVGFLYVGLMIGADKEPRVVEFNSRLGDPETQVLLPKLKSDLFEILYSACKGQLDADQEILWDRRSAITVILASEGYPQQPKIGAEIFGLEQVRSNEENLDVIVFHAGTQLQNDKLVTSGGRVLCVTVLAESLRVAQQKAYEQVKKINFTGMQYRTDIGWRAIK